MRRPFLIRSSITLMGVAAGLSLAACTSTETATATLKGHCLQQVHPFPLRFINAGFRT